MKINKEECYSRGWWGISFAWWKANRRYSQDSLAVFILNSPLNCVLWLIWCLFMKQPVENALSLSLCQSLASQRIKCMYLCEIAASYCDETNTVLFCWLCRINISTWYSINQFCAWKPCPDLWWTCRSQAVVYINNIPSMCSGNCSFEWTPEKTPVLTGISPSQGVFLKHWWSETSLWSQNLSILFI